MKRLAKSLLLSSVLGAAALPVYGSAPSEVEQARFPGQSETSGTLETAIRDHASTPDHQNESSDNGASILAANKDPVIAISEQAEPAPGPDIDTDKRLGKEKLIEPEPSDARYVLSRGVLTLGEARFQLTRQADNPACWRYQTVAKPSGLAKLLIGKVSERSDFCMADGKVISQYFEFVRSDKQEESFSLDFDWKDAVVRSSAGDMRPLESGMIDRLAMQIAVQNWVVAREGKVGPDTITLTKVEDDRIKAYSFQIMAKEKIETPAGVFDTIRVERVNDPKKKTLFWLAPSRGYLAVRVEQIKKGSEQLKMLLVN